MTDTSIGVSKEAHKLLKKFKSYEESFDKAVKDLFEYELKSGDEDYFRLKTPFGWIFFDFYDVTGTSILLRMKNEKGKPYTPTGEGDYRTPNFPMSEIMKRAPHYQFFIEGGTIGMIKGSGQVVEREEGAPFVKTEPYYAVEEIDTDGEKVIVRNLVQEEDETYEVDDVIRAVNKFRLKEVRTWEGVNFNKERAMFEIEHKDIDF